METLHRLNLASPDLAEEAKAGLREMFPEAFDEQGQLDFARLKELLGEFADGDKTRYGLSWAGKQDAKRALLSQSVGTLAPMREESVEFDQTENLIIEGDNLEVLKLLQKAYYGKVKMIYIDPPYNTGNDFIYPDNFREGLTDYLKYSGQVSEEGFRTSSNTETSGRYHSNWLNMMYPRLALARNLLREDGVIFVSIDDHEVHNLRLLMDEVFGEENFVGVIKRRAARKTAHLSKEMSDVCDYVVAYCRSEMSSPLSVQSVEDATRPVLNQGNAIVERVIRAGVEARCDDGTYPAGDYGVRTTGFELIDDLVIADGKVSIDCRARGPFRVNQTLLDKTLYVTRNIGLRRYLLPEEIDAPKAMSDLLDDPTIYNEKGTEELAALLGVPEGASRSGGAAVIMVTMTRPKPVGLPKYLALAASGGEMDFIILDFFAGSGTTAQAVMELNQEDGGNRRFILVQLPEPLEPPIKLDDGNELTTIADICRERVRRAAKKIAAKTEGKLDLEDSKRDLGFRAFKLTSSNFKLWEDTTEGDTEKLKEQLKLYAENILPDRDPEWVLYEILLKSGIELSAPVESIEVDGEPVFKIAGGRLLAYLNDPVDESALRKLIEMGAEKIVCLDHGFRGNDSLKANIAQQVKQWNSHHPEKPVDFRTV